MKGDKSYGSPGALLKSELKSRKITQKNFAESVSLMPSQISEIISGKRSISPSVATRFQDFFGIPAKQWLDLQTEFRLNQGCDFEESAFAETLYQYDQYISLKTIFARCDGGKALNNREKVVFLKNQLGIVSVKQLQQSFGFFKKSEKTGLDVRMLNTWTILARYEAQSCEVTGEFDGTKLELIGQELSRVFHKNENTLIRTANVLGRYGVRFCVTRKVELASVDGFSFIENKKPAIVITRRFDRIDNLAFTVLHELCHVCRHLDSDGDQRINIEGYSSEAQKEEYEANAFASNMLIPESIWEKAPAVRPIPHLIQKTYTRWAQEQGLNKWIVLGRIAHDLGIYQMRVDHQRSVQ